MKLKDSAHLTDWNSRYEAGDTPWEKGAAAPPLLEYLRKHQVSGSVFVPGCGYGHDVRLLAKHGAEPLGFDLAPFALACAESFPRVGAESYCLGDLFDLDESFRERFDTVFEHTCFCAIDPSLREEYVRVIHSTLRKSGTLLAIFYIEIEDPEGPPFPVSDEELDSLFDPHFKTMRRWIPSMAYPGRENCEQMRLMRRL